MPIFLFLIHLSAFAGLSQDQFEMSEKLNFDLKTVCQKMLPHESPLIEIKSANTLDCMSRKIEVADFCDKELAADPYYIRGYIDTDKKQVICLSAKKVSITYQCAKKSDQAICRGSAISNCSSIKKKLARRLEVMNASFSKSEKGLAELKCEFGLPRLKPSGL